MAKVGDQAHTDHGIGKIAEVLNERGRLSYKVTGSNFSVWVDETKLRVATDNLFSYGPMMHEQEQALSHPEVGYGSNPAPFGGEDDSIEHFAGLETTIVPGDPYTVNERNHTTLPYNYTPQYPVDLFNKEQTILPGDYEIDPDKRLHPSDSVSGKSRTDPSGPQPNKDLFLPRTDHPFADQRTAGIWNWDSHNDDAAMAEVKKHWGEPVMGPKMDWDTYEEHKRRHPEHGLLPQGSRNAAEHEKPFAVGWQSDGPGAHEAFPNGHPQHYAPDTHQVGMGDDEYNAYMSEEPGLSGGKHETYDYEPRQTQEQYETSPRDFSTPGYHPGKEIITPNSEERIAAGDPSAQWHDTHPHDEGGFHDTGVEGYDEYNPYSQHHGNYRPAGLDARYAHILAAPGLDSPVSQFRADPVGFIRTCGHLWTDGDDSLHQKFADYTNMLDSRTKLGASMRESAWKDVAAKASRLRHENKVLVHDINHNRIYATVEGDHGTYDVMLAKSAALPSTQSVADWTCSCDWGRWAFKRTMTYIGRLCSHAYAAYQEMQSAYLKDNPQHFTKKKGRTAALVDDYKSWLTDNDQVPEASSVAAFLHTTKRNDVSEEEVRKLYDYASGNPQESPERNFDIDYTNDPEKAYKQADKLLRTRPQSLTPNLQEVPEGEDEKWVDVTKDERETTGPDDIVHFSSANTLMRLHGASEGITDFSSGGGGGYSASPGTGATDGASAPSSGTPPEDSGAGTGGMGTGGSGGESIWSGSGNDAAGEPPDPTTGGGGPPVMNNKASEGMGPYNMSSRNPRYAEASDGGLLDKLRNMSETQPDDYGHMDSHNEEMRDLVQELQDRGYDASYMVAARPQTTDTDAADGDGNFLGQSNPNWADESFSGSGPDPKDWMSDSAGYVEENEDPHVEKDWFDQPDGDIIKFNDSRSKPQQGPRNSRRQAAGYGEPNGYIHPNDFVPESEARYLDWDQEQHMRADSDTGQKHYHNPAEQHFHQADVFNSQSGVVSGDTGGMTDQADQGALGGGDLATPTESFDPSVALASLHHSSGGDIDPEIYGGESGTDMGSPGDYSSTPATGMGMGDYAGMGGGSDPIEASRRRGAGDPASSGYFNPNNAGADDWQAGSGEDFANEAEQDAQDVGNSMPGTSEGGEGGGEGEAGGEGGAAGAAAEIPPIPAGINPERLHDQRMGSFDATAAFDRGEFSFGDTPGGGELRRAGRVGGGARQAPRIDPGYRGHQKVAGPGMTPPDDFGFDGGREMEAYLAEGDDPSGMDVLANFHRSGAAGSIMSEPQTRPGSTDDFSSSPMVQAMLRTAGRVYSPEEQRELEAEYHPQGARNMPTTDDLAGTHYLLGL